MLNFNRTVSLVIPTLNNPTGVRDILDRIQDLCNENHQLKIDAIIVDDESSTESLKSLAENIERSYVFPIDLIAMRKRCGQHSATLCGLRHAKGDIIVTVDDDDKLLMVDACSAIDLLIEGHLDLVMVERQYENQPMSRNIGSHAINYLNYYFYGLRRGNKTSSCRVMTRGLVSKLCETTSPFPYLNGDLVRLTNSYISVKSTVKKPAQNSRYRLSGLVFSLLRSVWNAYARLCSLAVRFNLLLFTLSLLSYIAFGFHWMPFFLTAISIDILVIVGGIGVITDVVFSRPQYGVFSVRTTRQ